MIVEIEVWWVKHSYTMVLKRIGNQVFLAWLGYSRVRIGGGKVTSGQRVFWNVYNSGVWLEGAKKKTGCDETKEGKDSVETEKNINVVQWSTQEEAPARRRGERSSGLLKWSSKMEAEPRSSCHSPPWAWAECQHHHTLWSFFRRQRGARWAVESLREGI